MTTPAKPRQWKQFPLIDPRSQQRKGGISLPSNPKACADKTAKLRKAAI